MIVAIVLFVLVGVALGLLGGGGSILALPILVYVLGLEAKSAIATSLLVVGVTSAVAAISHARGLRVDLRVGAAFAVTSIAGAYGGARVARLLPSAVLLAGFAVMMLVTGLAMLRGRAVTEVHDARRSWAGIAASGVAIGAVTGLVGAGGGFVIVPALMLLCGLDMQKAIGTSVLVIAANSLAGFGGYVGHVPIDARATGAVLAASVAGSLAGAHVAGRVPPEALRRVFAWFVLVMAVVMLGKQSASWAVAAFAGAVAMAGALAVRKTRTLADGR